MNRKGQALVEFVLILPVLTFMLLVMIDIGKMMIMKNHLESLLGEIEIDTTSVSDMEYDIKVSRSDLGSSVLIELESCIDVTTPGFNKIVGDPACVKTSKIFEKEGAV